VFNDHRRYRMGKFDRLTVPMIPLKDEGRVVSFALISSVWRWDRPSETQPAPGWSIKRREGARRSLGAVRDRMVVDPLLAHASLSTAAALEGPLTWHGVCLVAGVELRR